MSAPSLASISVDLDSLPHYCRIQGLAESTLSEDALSAVATRAIPRFLELFARVGTTATFFVIGSDLALPGMKRALLDSHAAGVELANHSWSHDYALSRWPREDIDADLLRSEKAIAELGVEVKGFRAPGYTLTPRLLQAVASRGYEYDSSAFPATPYYLAKASVMGALALLQRPSRAILDSPTVLGAPRVPYRPSLTAPYRRGHAPLVELPMAIAPVTRVPFIGTFVTSAPWPLVELTFRTLKSDAFINFELHAIDVLDDTDGVPEALARQQRDLHVPARQKLERLEKVFRWLGEARQRVTVLEAARALRPLAEGATE
ncbi:MAG: polysaccharide deacetylase family protein [Myxococcaceae bacterium]